MTPQTLNISQKIQYFTPRCLWRDYKLWNERNYDDNYREHRCSFHGTDYVYFSISRIHQRWYIGPFQEKKRYKREEKRTTISNRKNHTGSSRTRNKRRDVLIPCYESSQGEWITVVSEVKNLHRSDRRVTETWRRWISLKKCVLLTNYVKIDLI